MTNPNDPAAPCEPMWDHEGNETPGTFPGLTKREAFAMAAMHGICANSEFAMATFEVIAKSSVELADCLKAALNHPTE